METMYERIKRLRIAKGLSQEELANKCGFTSRSSISKIEKGLRDIPVLKPIEAFLQKRKGIIFPSPKGGYMTKSDYQKGWNKFLTDNDIHLTAHQLRHGFATICYDANLDEKDAAELLGHSSVELTKDIYTHITAERSRINAEKLNEFLTNF